MRQLQSDITKIAIAGIALTGLYNILAIGKTPGSSALALARTAFTGYGNVLLIGRGANPQAY